MGIRKLKALLKKKILLIGVKILRELNPHALKVESINETLSTIENQIRQAENSLINTNMSLTLSNLLDILSGESYNPKTFLEVFHNHNKKIDRLAKAGEYVNVIETGAEYHLRTATTNKFNNIG